MDRVIELVRKEVRQLRRDRQMLPFLFVVPVLQLLLFGFAISTDVKHLRVAICDLDSSYTSRTMVRELGASEYFDVASYLARIQEADATLDDGTATIVVVLPRGLERDLLAGRTISIQVLLDGSDAASATVAMAYLTRFAQQHSARLMEFRRIHQGAAARSVPDIVMETRFWYNPLLASSVFLVPGAMCVIIGMSATIATALAIVRERETGTIEQLIVTPIQPWELMLGKTVPFLGVGLYNVSMVLAANAAVFHVPLRGSIGLLYASSALFLVSSLAVGLLVSTVSRTQQQAILTAFFFLMPNFLLSGFMFPIENMPVPLQWVTTLLPLRYFLVIVRGIFLKGVGIAGLADQLWLLAALTLGIMVVAVWRFHKRLD